MRRWYGWQLRNDAVVANSSRLSFARRWPIISVKPKTTAPRAFAHIDHPSFRDRATDDVLFPPGSSLPKLPPAAHLDPTHQQTRPPLLSREDERRLFLGMNLAKLRAAQAQGRRASRDLAAWAFRADHVREYLVRCNMPLIPYCFHVARTMVAALDPDHVFSLGMAALVHSVDKFDGTRGYKFSSYACRAILNSLSRAAKESAKRAKRMPAHGFNDEIYRVPDGADPTDAAERAEVLHAALDSNAAGLTDIERFVIDQRFLSDDRPTLTAIGELLGVTKERVRQHQMRALCKLRDVLDPELVA